MKYRSTRGDCQGLTFEEALLSGYTSEGGILMPENVPKVTPDTLKQWAKLSYGDLCKEVAGCFISEDEIPRKDLSALLDRAFARFTIPEVIKTARLKDGLNILELFHGPTLAFKDLGLSCVGQFLNYFLEKKKKHATVLVGTSGDTGSAAIECVRGLKWVDIIVLLPRGRCARIQELQMTTVIEDNVHVFRVDGTSDDLDEPIKGVFLDADFAKRHSLCSVNSINWARITVQIAHYFYVYFQMRPECDGIVEVAIPTGACGNVTSACVAREMGLPIQMVSCVNVNDIVARTMDQGDFSMSENVIPTLSPAMDIQMPYNVERILYMFCNGNSNVVKQVLGEFESTGKSVIPTEIHNKIKKAISGFVVEEETMMATMKRCWQENEYLLCPHTAIAVAYHYSKTKGSSGADNGIPRVCIATASPAKFEEAVTAAGLTPQPTESVKSLPDKPTRYQDLEKEEDWNAILREKIEEITKRCGH